MGDITSSGSRLRVAIPLLLTAVILVATGVWIDDEHSDEAEVLWITDRLIDAWVEGDFETVWELSLEGNREKSPSLDMPVAERREVYLAHQRFLATEYPEEWRRQVKVLRRLTVEAVLPDPVNVNKPWLQVWFKQRPGDWLRVIFTFVHVDGAWRFSDAFQGNFRTLFRKVALFLPPDDLERLGCPVNLIVEIGPDGIDEKGAAYLTGYLTALQIDPSVELSVLLEVSADLPFSQVLVAVDAAMNAEIWPITFADTTTNGRPPPGIRVNGVDLVELLAVPPLPPLPEDHPALDQIIMTGRE